MKKTLLVTTVVILFAFCTTGCSDDTKPPEKPVAGWTSVIGSILLLSGVQLIIMGILGEYVGKIFEQVKQRPGYIIGNYVSASHQHKENSPENIYKAIPKNETP